MPGGDVALAINAWRVFSEGIHASRRLSASVPPAMRVANPSFVKDKIMYSYSYLNIKISLTSGSSLLVNPISDTIPVLFKLAGLFPMRSKKLVVGSIFFVGVGVSLKILQTIGSSLLFCFTSEGFVVKISLKNVTELEPDICVELCSKYLLKLGVFSKKKKKTSTIYTKIKNYYRK